MKIQSAPLGYAIKLSTYFHVAYLIIYNLLYLQLLLPRNYMDIGIDTMKGPRFNLLQVIHIEILS